MKAVVLALALLLNGCMARVFDTAPMTADEVLDKTTWCFVAVVEGHEVVSCTTNRNLCYRAVKLGKTRGGLAKVSSIDGCEKRGGR